MRNRTLDFLTLTLAMLGLIMGGAHVLELVPKLQYDAALYVQVNTTLYRYYGLAGGTVQVLALTASAALAWSVRRSPGFRWTMAGLLCLAVSLGLWFALVQPVNSEWARVLRSGPTEAVLNSFLRLRGRWEWGHIAAFVAWLAGTCSLVLGSLQRPAAGAAKEGSEGST